MKPLLLDVPQRLEWVKFLQTYNSQAINLIRSNTDPKRVGQVNGCYITEEKIRYQKQLTI